MTKPATDKQIAYRNDLIERALGNARGMSMAKSAYNTVLVLALPEVTTMEEVSEQIDALRYNGLARYYLATPERKEAIEAKLQLLAAAYGQQFERTPDHRDVGPAAWVAAIEAIINPQPETATEEEPVTTDAIHAAHNAEYDRLQAEYQAARMPEGVIDRFRDDLTAAEQAAIDHNDKLLAEWQAASKALQAKRVAALAEAEGVTIAEVERRYGNPVLAS